MSDKTEIGDRMKLYEGFETSRKLLPLIPACARMDGIGFHNFCRDLKRPYDPDMSALMIEVATWLATEFNANAAYTQSDEITLSWNQEEFKAEMFCGGKIQKLTSHLAAKTSVRFNKLLPSYLPKKQAEDAYFDARVWNVPNDVEASNVFLWRELDATRNSVQMAGRTHFSHKELFNKNSSDIQEMLFQKHNINWNNYPGFFKRGTFIIRKKILSKFDNIEELPENHAARKNPDLMIKRTRYVVYEMPQFSRVTNRTGVLFNGEEPKLNSEVLP